jgi:hypothetical protein
MTLACGTDVNLMVALDALHVPVCRVNVYIYD